MFVLIFYISLILSGVTAITVNTENKCACSEIKTMSECNVNCFWNQISGACQDPPITFRRDSYCNLVQNECNQTQGCGNYFGICIPFTGCSVISYKSNTQCQSYSNQCITDGKKCVLKDICSTYKTVFSCKVNYINGIQNGYCYWDKTECRQPVLCSELSLTLKSDAECRAQFSYCTAKIGGGCQNSGQQCGDQLNQNQCKSNKNLQTTCYWNGSKCYDQKCQYINLTECIEYGCSIGTSQCIDRVDCNLYKTELSCTYDENNNQCMWEASSCVQKLCSNGSVSRVTNTQCQEIYNYCITKFGGGCVNNGECDIADNKAGCSLNIRGETCYWNGYSCQLKQCQLAPEVYKSIKSCSLFMSNCAYDGSNCVENGCYTINNSDKCTNTCKWRNVCDIKTCETASKDINYISHDDCYSYMNSCTVSDSGVGCTQIKYQCSQYLYERQCQLSILNKCSWNNNTCQDRQCEFGTYTTHSLCNNFLNGCTTDGTKCISPLKLCQSYTFSDQCVYNNSNQQCIWTTQCVNLTCGLIPKTSTYNSHSACNGYMNTCTVVQRIYGCQSLPDLCTDYNSDQCVNSDICILSNGKCRNKVCSDYTGTISQTNCENFISGKKCMTSPGRNPTYCTDKVECDQIFSEYQCITDLNQKSCQWIYGKCVLSTQYCTLDGKDVKCYDKSCDYCTNTIKPTDTLTNILCEECLSTCLFSQSVCESKSTDDCGYQYTQTVCESFTACYWSSTSTCVELLDNCSQYTSSDCNYVTDSQGNQCATSRNDSSSCVQQCSNIIPDNNSCSEQLENCVFYDASTCTIKQSCNSYDTNKLQCNDDISCAFIDGNCQDRKCSDITDESSDHSSCNKYLSSCTVIYPGGCTQLLASCLEYTSEIQCNVTISNKNCFWDSNKCKDVICENIPDSTKCKTYFNQYSLKCVINQDSTNCISLFNNCNEYSTEQCDIQSDGTKCIWSNNKCQIASCNLLQVSPYNHINCNNDLSFCTVNQQFDACTDLLQDCSDYYNQEQCVIQSDGTQCIWNDYYSKCNRKTCFDTNIQAGNCATYLSTCVKSINNCRNGICEDFIYESDQECENAMSGCTTNGQYCIKRNVCQQNPKAGCIKDNNNKLCGWSNGKCIYITCIDAPITIISDQDCKQYFPNEQCLNKPTGGCYVPESCYSYLSSTQCKNANCKWDTQEFCRPLQCDDKKGITLLDCMKYLPGCITNGTNCIDAINCADITNSDQCLYGLDGPCLYINNKCYQYSKCESLNFLTHNACYQIQQECTSNGQNCIPLAFCSDYSSQISCIIGLEGECAWNNGQCSTFTDCTNYIYLTHKECNSINSQCTTNVISGCQKTDSCSTYQYKENCVKNSKGIITTENTVTSTGTCQWDGSQCSDSTCSSLEGTTHLACNSQLSTCTTNGLKCITIQDCYSYSQNSCLVAKGNNGECSYQNSQCQDLDCYSLTSSICTNYTKCQLVKSICQELLNCSQYSEEKYCTLGNDGQCIWLNSKCIEITQCSQANLSTLCNKSSCYWNSTSQTCQDHTCLTHQQYLYCGNYYNYNSSNLTYCQIVNSTCSEVDPTTFTQPFCYSLSYGFYTYDQSCQSCKYVATNTSNTTQPINNTNNSSLGSIIKIIMLLLLLII